MATVNPLMKFLFESPKKKPHATKNSTVAEDRALVMEEKITEHHVLTVNEAVAELENIG